MSVFDSSPERRDGLDRIRGRNIPGIGPPDAARRFLSPAQLHSGGAGDLLPFTRRHAVRHADAAACADARTTR